MMGGALGLAVLASLAASRSDSLLASGDNAPVALNGGYHAAFLIAAVFAVAAAVGLRSWAILHRSMEPHGIHLGGRFT